MIGTCQPAGLSDLVPHGSVAISECAVGASGHARQREAHDDNHAQDEESHDVPMHEPEDHFTITRRALSFDHWIAASDARTLTAHLTDRSPQYFDIKVFNTYLICVSRSGGADANAWAGGGQERI